MQKLLLLSNSTMPGTSFFTWPRPWVSAFLGTRPLNLAFIPYAAVTFSFDEYEEKVREVFAAMNYSVSSIHNVKDKCQAIENADGIVVGGGNTFALLTRVCEENLLALIQKKIASGTPYIGWSAGSNIASPTIKTTNDMPIVQPPSLNALNLVPFQINPHYHELKFEGQGGETRIDRLTEFLALNQQRKVIGLPEGMLLKLESGKLMLEGNGVAKLFEYQKPIHALNSGTDLSFLLH